MQKHQGIKRVLDYVVMTLSAATYGIAIGLFLDPNMLAPGGVAGISIIISHLTHVQTGTLVLLMNIPIFLFGLWKFGFRFTLRPAGEPAKAEKRPVCGFPFPCRSFVLLAFERGERISL